MRVPFLYHWYVKDGVPVTVAVRIIGESIPMTPESVLGVSVTEGGVGSATVSDTSEAFHLRRVSKALVPEDNTGELRLRPVVIDVPE
jgi:hypothetical protein